MVYQLKERYGEEYFKDYEEYLKANPKKIKNFSRLDYIKMIDSTDSADWKEHEKKLKEKVKKNNQIKQKPRLLLIDDNKDYINSLEFILKNHFELDTAGDLESAIEKINSNEYDIISTDGAIPQYKNGPLGDHGYLSKEDYRGNTVAKTAKSKGMYVLGVTSEPSKLTEPDKVIKKPIDVISYMNLLKEIVYNKKGEKRK